MATVIAFPKLEGKVRDKAEGEGPATILMFTGVRVERLEEDSSASRNSTRRIYASNTQATAEELEA